LVFLYGHFDIGIFFFFFNKLTLHKNLKNLNWDAWRKSGPQLKSNLKSNKIFSQFWLIIYMNGETLIVLQNVILYKC